MYKIDYLVFDTQIIFQHQQEARGNRRLNNLSRSQAAGASPTKHRMVGTCC